MDRVNLCGSCEEGLGVDIVATRIFPGHFSSANSLSATPNHTSLQKYLDLNSQSPFGGQNKLFNW